MNAQLVVSLITYFAIANFFLTATAYIILLERRIAAWTQDRVGPNRVGFNLGLNHIWDGLRNLPGIGAIASLLKNFHFWGLGQPAADGMKMFFKEDYTPPFVDRALFILAPILAFVPALIAWAVIPWGGTLQWGDEQLVVAAAPIHIGVVYILAVGSLAVYGVVLAGFASNNKYSFFGGLRATAQMLSYEIPMGIGVLLIILMYATPRADLIVEHQNVGTWNIFYQPLMALIFFICILAECNRAPFDLAEAEQELVGGYHTEYSSMKFGMFFLGEYVHMMAGAAFFTLLFLGGWSPLPFVEILPAVGGIFDVILKANIFIGKIVLLVAVMIWIRWTLPRFRFDQLMRLAWRGLIPISLVLLLASGTITFLQQQQVLSHGKWWMMVANLVVLAALPLVAPLMNAGTRSNRRVPLAGSRFSPPVSSQGVGR